MERRDTLSLLAIFLIDRHELRRTRAAQPLQT